MLAGLPESIIVELDFYVTVHMPVEPNLTAEEAQDEAAVPETLYENGTGGTSGNSSQTDMEEKLGGEKEKYRPSSSVETNFITWHSGRADLHTVLSGMAKVATGPISVNGESQIVPRLSLFNADDTSPLQYVDRELSRLPLQELSRLSAPQRMF